MSIHRWTLAALIAGALLPVGAIGDIVKLPGQAAAAVMLDNVPSRGMSMSQVEQRYGAPDTRGMAVGQPPITRWDYRRYAVYFEGDRVIHSVARAAR